jgi:hypothetical protein
VMARASAALMGRFGHLGGSSPVSAPGPARGAHRHRGHSRIGPGGAEFAAQLGAGGAAGGGDPVAGVHSAPAGYRGKWLLIFDNAPEQAAVQGFVPSAGNGRMLITSQSAIWPPGRR